MASARTLGRQARKLAEHANDSLMRASEAGIAAARTIAVRSERIAAAASDPRRLSDPELSLMVTEKVQAMSDSVAATLPHMAAPAILASEWMARQTTLWTRLMNASTNRTLHASSASLWKFWQGAALANAAFGTALLASMAEAGSLAFKPMHTAVTANAKRLHRR